MPVVRRVCLVAGATVVGSLALAVPVFATEMVVHPTPLNWPHSGAFSSHDHAALRRGYQVYKEVCSACHSMKFVPYRHLVGHILTEDEAKAECSAVRLWGPLFVKLLPHLNLQICPGVSLCFCIFFKMQSIV